MSPPQDSASGVAAVQPSSGPPPAATRGGQRGGAHCGQSPSTLRPRATRTAQVSGQQGAASISVPCDSPRRGTPVLQTLCGHKDTQVEVWNTCRSHKLLKRWEFNTHKALRYFSCVVPFNPQKASRGACNYPTHPYAGGCHGQDPNSSPTPATLVRAGGARSGSLQRGSLLLMGTGEKPHKSPQKPAPWGPGDGVE